MDALSAKNHFPFARKIARIAFKILIVMFGLIRLLAKAAFKSMKFVLTFIGLVLAAHAESEKNSRANSQDEYPWQKEADPFDLTVEGQTTYNMKYGDREKDLGF